MGSSMTPERWQRLKHVIESALERDAADRGAYLAEACGEDVALRAEAESFVAAHEEDPSFMEDPAWEGPVALPADRGIRAALEPGRSIGAYQIVRSIASGGMGAVYLAVRADDAYRKQVAIKVIRTDPYCDPRHREELLRRFRTERQTLANLEHPNIARLLDGGSTDDGIPYLVMEYIEGLQIDRFCDERRLSTDARLALFRKICQAVNYAHQSLVIHRDLKPGNILVTAEGVPKLLDFGLAKLLDRDSSALAATLTQTGRQPMTPAYASPEQIRGQPVTTATDVYSLGVILFELLTGHAPYRGRAMHEIARLICEEEPIRPSAAVTQTESVASLDGGPPMLRTPESISRVRDDRPERLRRRLSGDIDMIVLKALRKEPEHRYPSVDLFAEDIRRHMEGEPVLARKGTAGYYTFKFIRRHRIGVAAGFLLLLTLAGGLTTTYLNMREAERNQHKAERNEQAMVVVANFWEKMFERSNPDDPKSDPIDWSRRGKKPQVTMDELLRRGATRLPHLDEHPLVEATMSYNLGTFSYQWRQFDEALTLFQKAWVLRKRELGDSHPDTLISEANVGLVLMEQGKWEEARPILAEVVEKGAPVWGRADEKLFTAMHNLARVERKLGHSEDAERLLREALAGYHKTLDEENWRTLNVMNNLGTLLHERGDLAEAESLLRRTVELRRKVQSDDHAETIGALSDLATVLCARNEFVEAEQLLREAFDASARVLDEQDPLALTIGNNLAHCLMKLDRAEEAEKILGDVVETASAKLSKRDPNPAIYRSTYGECLTRLGRYDKAEQQLKMAHNYLVQRLGATHGATRKTVQRLVDLYEQRGDAAKAEEYRARLVERTPYPGGEPK
jgi:serine/threonine protein kinase/tetratricopeptide (TPR) repeat protein